MKMVPNSHFSSGPNLSNGNVYGTSIETNDLFSIKEMFLLNREIDPVVKIDETHSFINNFFYMFTCGRRYA